MNQNTKTRDNIFVMEISGTYNTHYHSGSKKHRVCNYESTLRYVHSATYVLKLETGHS